MDCVVQCSCTVNDDEGTLTVTFSGDFSATFALELAYSSKMLCNILEDGLEETQFVFSAPKALLCTWLSCARLLAAQTDTLASLNVPELVMYLKVRLIC